DDLKAMLLRIAKIRFPGGTEISTSQSENQEKEAAEKQKPPPTPQTGLPALPVELMPQQRAAVEEIIRAERATTYLWEYRYLNYFLVYHTQQVLDWLASLQQPITLRYFDSFWLPLIPSANERNAVITALQAHHLIQVTNDLIQVTPKGREYQQWRG